MFDTLLAAIVIGTTTLGSGSLSSTADIAPSNVTLPEIVGLDTVGSTLTVRPGTYDGSPSSLTYSWHMIGGSSLGTGTSFGPLTSAMVTACSGSTNSACGRLQVDETATNGAGSATAVSDFIGPVETSYPSAPPTGPGPTPSALPVYPAHFWQNGHTIYPGCVAPPAAPDVSNPAHVWYFDPVNGHTLAQGATGHVGDPFKDAGAIFGGVQGYGSLAGFTSVPIVTGTQAFLAGTSFGSGQGGSKVFVNGIEQGIQAWTNTSIEINLVPPGVVPTTGNTEVDVGLYGRSMQPGHVAYVKPDPTGASVGILAATNAYSTSDGTTTGTPIFTWIMADPSSSIAPVMTELTMTAAAGFIIKGINFEENGATISAQKGLGTQAWFDFIVTFGGSIAAPIHDIVLEGSNITNWIGHSNDPWDPSTYPSSGGHSDGTIQTASPYMGTNASDPAAFIVSASSNATQVFLENGVPFISTTTGPFTVVPYIYMWSPGYYYQIAFSNTTATPPNNTGIPNGTKIVNIQGRTDLINQGNITGGTATQANGGVTPTIKGTVTSSGALPPTGNTTGDIWAVVANTTNSTAIVALVWFGLGVCGELRPPSGYKFVGVFF